MGHAMTTCPLKPLPLNCYDFRKGNKARGDESGLEPVEIKLTL